MGNDVSQQIKQEKISSIYNNPKTSSRNATILAKRAEVTPKEAKLFLSTQASAIINKQFIQPPSDSSIYCPTGAPPGHWQADVIYFDDLKSVNDKRKAILTILNSTTRYVYARSLLNNTSIFVAGAIKDILNDMKRDEQLIVSLTVDGGAEFKGETEKLLASKKIEIKRTEKYTHYKIRRTDRFHHTLRKKIGELIERTGSDRYIDHLQDIIDNYNSTELTTFNKTIGKKAPKDITEKDEEKIRAEEIERVQKCREATNKLKVILGATRARLLVSKTKAGATDKFAKSHRNVWSRDTYLITERNGPNSFVLDVPPGEVKIWPVWALQLLSLEDSNNAVDTPIFPHSDPQAEAKSKRDLAKVVTKSKVHTKHVNMKVIRAKRMEERNISESEQLLNFLAPKNPKRVTKKVNYKALVSGKK